MGYGYCGVLISVTVCHNADVSYGLVQQGPIDTIIKQLNCHCHFVVKVQHLPKSGWARSVRSYHGFAAVHAKICQKRPAIFIATGKQITAASCWPSTLTLA